MNDWKMMQSGSLMGSSIPAERDILPEIKYEFDTCRGFSDVPEKDSRGKIFCSQKNEIKIKPLGVWTDNSIYGVFIVGFVVQLFISLTGFEIPELRHRSIKFVIDCYRI